MVEYGIIYTATTVQLGNRHNMRQFKEIKMSYVAMSMLFFRCQVLQSTVQRVAQGVQSAPQRHQTVY